jgi:hypothetical protein
VAKGNFKRKAARDEPKSEGDWPGLGLSSHIGSPLWNRLTHLSTVETLHTEAHKTDCNSLYLNLLPRPFIEKYLMRIFCSDLSILIFDNPEKSDDEKGNVSSQPQRIANFSYRQLRDQLILHAMLSSNNVIDFGISPSSPANSR